MKQQSKTLSDLASLLSAELVGEPDHKVTGLASISGACSADITFLSNEKLLTDLKNCRAGAVILKPDYADSFSGNKLLVGDPYLSYAKLSAIFDTRSRLKKGIHPSAHVAESARVSSSASIAANCVIDEYAVIEDGSEIYPGCYIGEHTRVGKDCLLHANVSLYRDVTLGDRVIVHSATVIGSDGFGFAPSSDEGWVKIHQLGGVRIGNDVEIGASVAIDRGAISDTVINDGVIIDNQVHLAHNVELGERTAIAGCVGIAGSTKIGKNCTVAGMVAINGHIEIADNTHFHGGTIVTKGNDKSGTYASASPLLDVRKWRRSCVRFSQMDEWVDRIKALEKTVNENKNTTIEE